jgi:hypothetical protein
MAAFIAAIGAVVGYVGAEVAEESMFERLLWPQRFYNYLDATAIAKLALLMPMSGPLHRAALETLDGFRDHGLYRGFLRGDMLGTAFFSEKPGLEYFHRTGPLTRRDTPEAVRNGFWVEVLRQLDENRARPAPKIDEEHTHASSNRQPTRTVKAIFRLHLESVDNNALSKTPHAVVSESRCTVWTYIGILASEFSTICVATATGLWRHFGSDEDNIPDAWIIGFFCIPLFLKLLAALLSVRRESIYRPDEAHIENASKAEPQTNMTIPPMDNTVTGSQSPELSTESPNDAAEPGAIDSSVSPTKPSSASTVPEKEIIQVIDPSLGFMLVSTSWPLSSAVSQTFGHYGHPIRSSFMDRVRETASICIVYAFVLYFPVGLFVLSWTNQDAQYIWLSQQLYAVLAMHIARLCGWQGCARTEERFAALLLQNKTVCLLGEKTSILATLDIEEVNSGRQGKARVLEILRQNDPTAVHLP